jgi:hypothetical protein
MKRFGTMGFAAALVTLALGAATPEAQAAEMSQAGFGYGGMGAGYGGWGGAMGAGYGGWGYASPAFGYAGYNGGMGGYAGGGGGWGYTGSCCNNIWAGYCNEIGCGRRCHVKHRCRALGCGAGPCCQPTCDTGACGDACGAPSCGSAAPCGRRHFCHRFRRACGSLCGMGSGCYSGSCGASMGYGYEEGAVMGGYDNIEPASPSDEAPAPAPEVIEQPAPEKAARRTT